MLPSSAGLPSSIGVVGVGTIGYALGMATSGFAESILVDSGMETVQYQYDKSYDSPPITAQSLVVPPRWHMLNTYVTHFWQLRIL